MGRLIADAPHDLVHVGTVAVSAAFPAMRQGVGKQYVSQLAQLEVTCAIRRAFLTRRTGRTPAVNQNVFDA